MTDDQTAALQQLIDRIQRSDDEARLELIGRAYDRLRHLSAVILRRSFPRLKKAPVMVDTTDVANESAYRLYQALAEIHPATVRDFFRLAAQRIRWLAAGPGQAGRPRRPAGTRRSAGGRSPGGLLGLRTAHGAGGALPAD